MTQIEIVQAALARTNEKLARMPSFDILISIKRQLEYIQSILVGEENDRGRLKDIIIGLYAVREYEASDQVYADLLIDANNIARELQQSRSEER